jgi:phosphoribosyl 1,2-cyclic phosphate phosphodiesterase
MPARFIFLGTGPAEAIPRQGHQDRLCLDARRRGSKSRRLRSSGLYVDGRTTLLFDAGPDISQQLAAERVEHLDGVLLTHAHLDAAGGLALIDRWAKARKLVLSVYTERATERRYGRFNNLSYRFIKPGEFVDFGDTTVRFFRVQHSVIPGFPTLGFRIGNFAYASDTYGFPLVTRHALAGVTDLILDGTFWFNTNFRGHLRVDESIELGKKLGVERLYLTQCGHTFPPYVEAAALVAEYAKKIAPGMVVTVAWDGLRIKCHSEAPSVPRNRLPS